MKPVSSGWRHVRVADMTKKLPRFFASWVGSDEKGRAACLSAAHAAHPLINRLWLGSVDDLRELLLTRCEEGRKALMAKPQV